MSTKALSDEQKLLARLALALVEAPRANLQELARQVGVSKATLYRFSPTRDELVSRVVNRCIEVVDEIVSEIDRDDLDPITILQRTAVKTQEHRELMTFMNSVWNYGDRISTATTKWFAKLDAFFLRGQRAGIFRIDVPAAVLTELWGSISQALIDAERRGRAARAGLPEMIESVFLEGVQAPKTP